MKSKLGDEFMIKNHGAKSTKRVKKRRMKQTKTKDEVGRLGEMGLCPSVAVAFE
jgi:hypothetical protein